MLLSIEAAEALDPQQRGQKQGGKATPKGDVAVMQQGKIVGRVRALICPDGLYEARHHWLKGLLLIKPTGKQVQADKGQTRRDADHCVARIHGDIC
jgi:hypothetical protein